MEVIYKSRHIHSVPELNLETDSWIPHANVSWEGRTKCHQLLTGPIGYFKIIDQAETYAVEMAKTWIDAESADDLLRACDCDRTAEETIVPCARTLLGCETVGAGKCD